MSLPSGKPDDKYETTFDEALNYMLKKSGLESQVEVNTVEQYMRPTQVPFLISDCSKFTAKPAGSLKNSRRHYG